uniref:Uncharacterized protein n=1 Tax=Arundo donax TaxID=35708 RepID=A0A0A9F2V9_ARUDO
MALETQISLQNKVKLDKPTHHNQSKATTISYQVN